MSYARQFNQGGQAIGLPDVADFTSVRTNRALDYSRSSLPPLDELVDPENGRNGLNEYVGIGGTPGSRTIFGGSGGPVSFIGSSSGSIDWNTNGVLELSVARILTKK